MIEAGIGNQLKNIRLTKQRIVNCPAIEMAIFMAEILEAVDGEKPIPFIECANAEDNKSV